MVEIALCLGIVAIALVAIIGVMPTGLKVQKDNREDTIINQDGTLWLEAIRGGARGLDYLTNYVDSITITNVTQSALDVTIYTNSPGLMVSGPPKIEGSMTNGSRIIGLLSRPKYLPVEAPQFTNHIVARVRAISGSAVEKDTNKVVREFAFAYQLKSEIVPLNVHPTESTNYRAAGLPPDEKLTRSNLWLLARNQAPNFHEVLLTLQGPVVPKGNKFDILGTPRTFRTLVGGVPFIEGTGPTAKPLFFIQPSVFTQVKP